MDDYENLELAIEKVKQSTEYMNTKLKIMDNQKKLLAVQKRLEAGIVKEEEVIQDLSLTPKSTPMTKGARQSTGGKEGSTTPENPTMNGIKKGEDKGGKKRISGTALSSLFNKFKRQGKDKAKSQSTTPQAVSPPEEGEEEPLPGLNIIKPHRLFVFEGKIIVFPSENDLTSLDEDQKKFEQIVFVFSDILMFCTEGKQTNSLVYVSEIEFLPSTGTIDSVPWVRDLTDVLFQYVGVKETLTFKVKDEKEKKKWIENLDKTIEINLRKKFDDQETPSKADPLYTPSQAYVYMKQQEESGIEKVEEITPKIEEEEEVKFTVDDEDDLKVEEISISVPRQHEVLKVEVEEVVSKQEMIVVAPLEVEDVSEEVISKEMDQQKMMEETNRLQAEKLKKEEEKKQEELKKEEEKKRVEKLRQEEEEKKQELKKQEEEEEEKKQAEKLRQEEEKKQEELKKEEEKKQELLKQEEEKKQELKKQELLKLEEEKLEAEKLKKEEELKRKQEEEELKRKQEEEEDEEPITSTQGGEEEKRKRNGKKRKSQTVSDDVVFEEKKVTTPPKKQYKEEEDVSQIDLLKKRLHSDNKYSKLPTPSTSKPTTPVYSTDESKMIEEIEKKENISLKGIKSHDLEQLLNAHKDSQSSVTFVSEKAKINYEAQITQIKRNLGKKKTKIGSVIDVMKFNSLFRLQKETIQ
jgi:hypothetical protein